MLDMTIVDTQSYSDTPLSPWVAALASPKTHKRGAIVLLTTLGLLVPGIAPSFAVERVDNWDWNSETRQENEAPKGQAVADLGYETGSLSQDGVEGEDSVEQSDSSTTNEQSQELEEMPANTARPNQSQSQEPSKIQVVGDDWRTGGRQTEAQAALEKNPGVEKDCNGKPFTEGDEQQAELDENGNVTAAGLAEIKAHGKSYCSQNPNEPQCKPDANGDVG
jgi:hypothetical protein